MAVEPYPLLAIAALVLGGSGALMIGASQTDLGRPALRDCGLGFAASAIGLAMIIAAPDAMTSPVSVLGNAAMMFGAGLVWSAACRLVGGVAPRPTAVAAGAIVWLGIVLAAAPSLGWCIGIISAILATYAFAAARVLTQDRSRLRDPQRRCGLVLAGHGAFHVLRAVLEPALGLAAWGASLSSGWDVLFGIETSLFAVLFGFGVFAMRRAPAAELAAGESLEDALTGIGNHHALSRSGTALLAEASANDCPLALLLMDLDGFRPLLERHGEGAGERLLVAFARLAHDYLPPTSLVCRLDHDAFAAVMPGATPERALVVADELRSLFAHLVLDGTDGPLATTVSIGIAQVRSGRLALSELLGAAIRSLSAAKAAGRNSVVHEAELPGGALRPAA